MTERMTRFISDNSHRYVVPRAQVYEPCEGEWCVAAWKGDSVFCKCQVLGKLENGDYEVFFPKYGYGDVPWRNVYKLVSSLPKGSKLDQYLREELDEILFRQSMGESQDTANELVIYENIDNEKVNEEIARKQKSEKDARKARIKAQNLEAEVKTYNEKKLATRSKIIDIEESSDEELDTNTSEEMKGVKKKAKKENMAVKWGEDVYVDIVEMESEEEELEDDDLMDIVIENVRSLEKQPKMNSPLRRPAKMKDYDETIENEENKEPDADKWKEEEVKHIEDFKKISDTKDEGKWEIVKFENTETEINMIKKKDDEEKAYAHNVDNETMTMGEEIETMNEDEYEEEEEAEKPEDPEYGFWFWLWYGIDWERILSINEEEVPRVEGGGDDIDEEENMKDENETQNKCEGWKLEEDGEIVKHIDERDRADNHEEYDIPNEDTVDAMEIEEEDDDVYETAEEDEAEESENEKEEEGDKFESKDEGRSDFEVKEDAEMSKPKEKEDVDEQEIRGSRVFRRNKGTEITMWPGKVGTFNAPPSKIFGNV